LVRRDTSGNYFVQKMATPPNIRASLQFCDKRGAGEIGAKHFFAP
jgi:hypothetical protein